MVTREASYALWSLDLLIEKCKLGGLACYIVASWRASCSNICILWLIFGFSLNRVRFSITMLLWHKTKSIIQFSSVDVLFCHYRLNGNTFILQHQALVFMKFQAGSEPFYIRLVSTWQWPVAPSSGSKITKLKPIIHMCLNNFSNIYSKMNSFSLFSFVNECLFIFLKEQFT